MFRNRIMIPVLRGAASSPSFSQAKEIRVPTTEEGSTNCAPATQSPIRLFVRPSDVERTTVTRDVITAAMDRAWEVK